MIINNEYVRRWVEELARLCRPDAIYWCNGSKEEFDYLAKIAVDSGTIKELNQASWPGCYAFSNKADDCVTQHEHSYVCTYEPENGSDTTQWMKPQDMLNKLEPIMADSMKNKVMYVIPYVMGPVGSPFSQLAIEVTDSIYVALNMSIITRMGDAAWRQIGDRDDFFRGVHISGTLSKQDRYIAHFPEDRMVYSINTEYGGYAFQSKSSMAMVLASAAAAKEGWLAEHMMIIGIETPSGEIHYVAGAFPTSCGKTNLALLIPPEYAKDYKAFTVGDDIAWLRPGPDGRLWAINPECGFFSVIPGVNDQSSPRAMDMVRHDTIFTNVAVSKDGLPWWEGMKTEPPEDLVNWEGLPWTKDSPYKAAHPNARFTSHVSHLSSLSKHWENIAGVPISAIIFGGRTRELDPLVREAYNWQHGVFLGASLLAERENKVERNPMGILPFLGCGMGSYLSNWLDMEDRLEEPPKIFRVNWFRKDERDRFIWPGYSENFRVLEWILRRCKGEAKASDTPIGRIPEAGEISTLGIKLNQAELMEELLSVDKARWQGESEEIRNFFKRFHDFPQELWDELDRQSEQLN